MNKVSWTSQRRPVPGDHGRPGDGRPDGGLPVRRRLALVEPAPDHRRAAVRRRRRLRLERPADAGRDRRRRGRPSTVAAVGGSTSPGISSRLPSGSIPSTVDWPLYPTDVAPHESSDRRDPDRSPPDGAASPARPAGPTPPVGPPPARGRGADPRRRSRPSARPAADGRRREPEPPAETPPTRARRRPPPPLDRRRRRAAARAGLVRPEGPELARGHDPRRPGAPGQDPGAPAVLRPDRGARPRRSPRSATTRSGSSSGRPIPATSWSRWS